MEMDQDFCRIYWYNDFPDRRSNLERGGAYTAMFKVLLKELRDTLRRQSLQQVLHMALKQKISVAWLRHEQSVLIGPTGRMDVCNILPHSK